MECRFDECTFAEYRDNLGNYYLKVSFLGYECAFKLDRYISQRELDGFCEKFYEEMNKRSFFSLMQRLEPEMKGRS